MSRDGAITLDWADGTYPFRFGLAEWEMLQEATDCGPWYLEALLFGTAIMLQKPEAVKDSKPRYLGEIIRCGLIGGGMSPKDALAKVRLYVHARPPGESLAPALAVLRAGLDGAPDEPPDDQKKSDPDDADENESLFPEANSRFADVYAWCGIVGIAASEIAGMSLWRFGAMTTGYVEANSTDDTDRMTTAESDEIWAWMHERGYVNGH